MRLDRKRFVVGIGALLTMLALAAAPAAVARTAYVTGGAEGGIGGFATAVELGREEAGTPILIAGVGEGAAPDVAITPDGSRAYVPNGADAVVPIDIATNTAEAPIPVGAAPIGIAITPDGRTAYVTTLSNTVVPIDLASAAAGAPIPVGQLPLGIAITPDGSRAYVSNFLSGTVSVIDLGTKAVTATIPVGTEPAGLAVSPDGTTVYLAEEAGVLPIAVATNAAGPLISGIGSGSFDIVITPSGARAYVLEGSGEAVPIELGSGSAGTGIGVLAAPRDIAIAPDGSRAYATLGFPIEALTSIDVATNTAGAPFAATEDSEAIAIVPNQPPHAAFSFSPTTPAAGSAVSFNAGSSFDPDGGVARYQWEFGDGSAATTSAPVATHAYAQPGTYQVTVTETDNEGCSTRFVFTGQTAYCNGSSVARATHSVTVASPGPATTSTSQPSGHRNHHTHPHHSCVVLSVKASSFVPKRRPGHVVPGVRVRVAPSVPGKVSIEVTLLRKQGDVRLGKTTVEVRRWRRMRFVLPRALRRKLPYGTPVTVKVRATLRPKNAHTCVLKKKQRPTRLDLHVVRVFPHAVQFRDSPSGPHQFREQKVRS